MKLPEFLKSFGIEWPEKKSFEGLAPYDREKIKSRNELIDELSEIDLPEPLMALNKCQLYEAYYNESGQGQMNPSTAKFIKYICSKFGAPPSKAVSEKELEEIIKKVLAPSCDCDSGKGIVCVGCFYRKDLAKAIAKLTAGEV